jgi:hypothetical protein
MKARVEEFACNESSALSRSLPVMNQAPFQLLSFASKAWDQQYSHYIITLGSSLWFKKRRSLISLPEQINVISVA